MCPDVLATLSVPNTSLKNDLDPGKLLLTDSVVLVKNEYISDLRTSVGVDIITNLKLWLMTSLGSCCVPGLRSENLPPPSAPVKPSDCKLI